MRNAQIDSLSIYTTTLCNLHCIGCCAGTQVKNNITVDEIIELRKHIPDLKDVFITGGEPTLHKHFRDIMEEILKINYERLILATNAFRLMKYIDLMDNFDEIRISHYDKDSYPNATPNSELIEEFKKAYKGSARIVVQHITMIPENDNSGVCGRAFNGIASYFRGKVYGCCVSAGMDTAKGIPIDDNWKESALKVELPCAECVFAQTSR
jgi:Radical SAM superfamily